MHEVQPRPVNGPPVYRMLMLVVLAVLLVAGGAVVFAGRSPTSAGSTVPLAADASQDPNASPAANASSAPDASPPPANEPGKGGMGGGWMGPGGPGRGGSFRGPGPFGGFGGGALPEGRGAISITSIDGNNLALKTDDGWTRTIDASGAKITRDGTAITLADLKVGDTIRLAETRNSDGTFTITEIAVIQPRVAGTATAVGSDTITLSQPDGTSVTVHVGSGTTFTVPGVTSPTIADLKVGNVVTATGSLRADGSLDATAVVVFNGQFPDRGGRGPGGYGPGGNGNGGNASPAPSTAPTT